MADVLTTRKQREMMEHAIGVPCRRGSKPGWRNYYSVHADNTVDVTTWRALVDAGLAKEGGMSMGRLIFFHVTDSGFAELGLRAPKSEVSK